MQPLKLASPEAIAALRALEARRDESLNAARRVADDMIAGVRSRGDAFVAEQIERFDRVTLVPSDILLTPSDSNIDP